MGPGLQRPAPSHANAPTTASPEQVPFLQMVPATKRRQAPAPSQVPSKPHVEGSADAHAVASRGLAPAMANVHVPGEPGAAHVLHDSAHAVPQHTPSTQKLLEHSEAHPQAWPVAFFVAASPHVTSGPVWSTLASVKPAESPLVTESTSTMAQQLRWIPTTRPASFFATASGGIGWGLPAAVGLALGDRARGVKRTVVATIGADEAGQAYNINADTVAGALAEALGAEKLIFLTDVEGLRVVPDDPSTLVHAASLEVVDDILRSGAAQGGMMPKVEACARAVRGGVARAHILDGRVPHALLLELFTDSGVGTMVLP